MGEVGLRPRRFTENTWIKHSPELNGEMFSRMYSLFRSQLVRQLTRYFEVSNNSRITRSSVLDLLLRVHVDSLENMAKLVEL